MNEACVMEALHKDEIVRIYFNRHIQQWRLEIKDNKGKLLRKNRTNDKAEACIWIADYDNPPIGNA